MSDRIDWQAGRLALTLVTDPARPPAIERITCDDRDVGGGSAPLVEVGVRGLGTASSSRRYRDAEWTARSRYVGHVIETVDGRSTLTVHSREDVTGLLVETRLAAADASRCLTVSSSVTDTGDRPITLEWVTSAVMGGLTRHSPDALHLHWADNDWMAENRWKDAGVRDLLPALDRAGGGLDGKACFTRSSQGTWSTNGGLPMAAVIDADGVGLGWQIEHNGEWLWQIGVDDGHAYVSLLGPTDREHQWSQTLAPGEVFRTMPATLAVTTSGWTGITDELTAHRRRTRRPHPSLRTLPVVFNDYMNTLMGDPTSDKLEPLIDAAASVGAEIFCIDAGWYDEDGDGWWDAVGAWEPSVSRFPGGLRRITERIRQRGMVPGLWLEPEVVGVRSPVADRLPADAFFQRGGVRVVEHGRYHLDLRHPRAREHLDTVVDRLVRELDVGYFKLDYNINPGPGTDRDADSAGAGLLGHNRAHLDWLDGVLERHPQLVLENCGSGALRADPALLSRLQLQSTSDQQDPVQYPAIAAAANAAMTPEQAGNWAYPQADYDVGRNVITLLCGMLGRMYLSGHFDAMSDSQLATVTSAVNSYRTLRSKIPAAMPFWPLGMPGWTDDWVAHGLRTESGCYVAVWRRGGDSDAVALPLPGSFESVRIMAPASLGAAASIVDGGTTVRVVVPEAVGGVLLATS